MALWSLWSAPLLMSNDLPNIPASSKKLLLCVAPCTLYSCTRTNMFGCRCM
jgi:hypothetical protein|eukprot:COSAG01_NODE_3310_length_6282_cov_2.911693_7_plen_51_part_00